MTAAKRPVKTAGYSNKTRKAKAAKRKAEAEGRAAAWQAMTPEAKLESLRSRRGECLRQIERINRKLSKLK